MKRLLWGFDEIPALPTDGTPQPQPRYFPAHGGVRFTFFTLPPESQAAPENIDIPAALAELDEKLPGIAEVMEPDHRACTPRTRSTLR